MGVQDRALLACAWAMERNPHRSIYALALVLTASASTLDLPRIFDIVQAASIRKPPRFLLSAAFRNLQSFSRNSSSWNFSHRCGVLETGLNSPDISALLLSVSVIHPVHGLSLQQAVTMASPPAILPSGRQELHRLDFVKEPCSDQRLEASPNLPTCSPCSDPRHPFASARTSVLDLHFMDRTVFLLSWQIPAGMVLSLMNRHL
jgi:hypothetical protein